MKADATWSRAAFTFSVPGACGQLFKVREQMVQSLKLRDQGLALPLGQSSLLDLADNCVTAFRVKLPIPFHPLLQALHIGIPFGLRNRDALIVCISVRKLLEDDIAQLVRIRGVDDGFQHLPRDRCIRVSIDLLGKGGSPRRADDSTKRYKSERLQVCVHLAGCRLERMVRGLVATGTPAALMNAR